MSAGIRINRTLLQPTIDRIIETLSPVSHNISIAGSHRRLCATVADVEIVASPHRLMDLFEEETDEIAADFLESLGSLSDIITLDNNVKRNGNGYKRFITTIDEEKVPVEFFLSNRENYGNILAIRTGNEYFTKALVTISNFGGLMPNNLAQADGYMWDFPTYQLRQQWKQSHLPVRGGDFGMKLIPCKTERDYFEALKLEYIEPECRTAETALSLGAKSTLFVDQNNTR